MPVFLKDELLATLQQDVRQIIEQARALPADPALLSRPPGAGRWSVAQVLAHLNFYSREYLPRLEAVMSGGRHADLEFRSGWLGNYFTRMMRPSDDGTVANKMSAPKEARPDPVPDSTSAVRTFIAEGERLLQLLEQARRADLSRRVPTSISSLIRLKAGDTFRFLVAHQQRHMAQVARTLDAVAGK